MAKKLEVRNLTISFRTTNGAVRAVRDVSFDLQEGETLAIAGESGSGKSVTNRAIMGILAGNAIVENGEIIYDGKDLLKIPEEEFHTLRGHKLSMVFQDPLSALNPIMRIGRQLTEAMILNNKERRQDGKKRFNDMLAELEKNIIASKVEQGASPEDAKAKTHAKTQEFDRFVVHSVQMENAWKNAQENGYGVLDTIEETDIALQEGNARKVKETLKRLLTVNEGVYNDYYIPKDDSAYASVVQRIRDLEKDFKMHRKDELSAALNELRDRLQEPLNRQGDDVPNFFRIGYAVTHGSQADPRNESIASINQRCLKALDDGFMRDFLQDTRMAISYAEKQALLKKEEAIKVLRKEEPLFDRTPLDEKACRESIKRSGAAVDQAVNRLALEKDNQSYVFSSSLAANLKRYSLGLKTNPKEHKRFAKETAEYEKATAAGKDAPSVVPLNLVDTERARLNMLHSIRNLISHYEEQISATTAEDDAKQAVELIDYMRDRSSDYAYKLSKTMARHRAIELMKEVGIPEPHIRFHQYPFEFSGGMRQRIVIAIALSANPDILICDEPTTALDVTIQAQILELINRLKKQRKLSVIFITHDLGVVANMADKIAIMYAGKIVEYGTADEVFYDPRHPYTWALLASMPDLETEEKLDAIPGTPPNMILPPKGDAFAARNHYALKIDFEEEPPAFHITDTHWAATWLLHPNAPKMEPPKIVTERIERMHRKEAAAAAQVTQEGGENS